MCNSVFCPVNLDVSLKTVKQQYDLKTIKFNFVSYCILWVSLSIVLIRYLSLVYICQLSCHPLPVPVCQGVCMSRNNCIKYSHASVFEPLFSAHSIMEFLNPIFDSIRQCESTKTSTGSWCLSFKQTRVTLSEHGCVTFPISKAMPRVGKKCDQKPVLNPPKSVWF